METSLNLCEPKLESKCAIQNELCTELNSNGKDRLSSIGYAKKIAGVYWTNAFKSLKINSYQVSKDVLFKAFGPTVLDNKVPVKLDPIFEDVQTTSKEEEDLFCGSNTTVTEADTVVLDWPGSKSEEQKLALVAETTMSEIDQDIETVGSLNVESQVVNGDHDLQTASLSVHANTALEDPERLQLLQRRLKSVSALADSDITESILIHQANLLVRDGYKQLCDSIMNVKRHVEDLSPLLPLLNTPMNESVPSSVVELSNPSNVASLHEPEEVAVVCLDDHTTEIFTTERYIDLTYHNVFYEDTANFFIYKEDINVCSDSDNSVSRFDIRKQRFVSSPSNTLFTYRSDDSLESKQLYIYDNCCRDSTIPLVFRSMPPQRDSENEEMRSLLSQNILLNRRRTYTHRRPRPLQIHYKSFLSRMVCLR
jgi:hypothetical protein